MEILLLDVVGLQDELLERYIEHTCQLPFNLAIFFMQDGAKVHTARVVETNLDEMGIQVMIRPLYLPDLNTI
jgi:hypothetical protein